jgi:hypothetical protein
MEPDMKPTSPSEHARRAARLVAFLRSSDARALAPRFALAFAAVTIAIVLAALPSPPVITAATKLPSLVATTPATTPAPKAAGVFGATCSADGDCASGACSKGNNGSFCSSKCAHDSDCPTPPTAGACNGRGYCKKTAPKSPHTEANHSEASHGHSH